MLALDSAEMAKALSICQSQLEMLARTGQFPSVMLGGRRVFPVEAARVYLTRHALAAVGETIGNEQIQPSEGEAGGE